MNVLFLLTQDIESPSGLGRYFPLAKALAHRNHEVTLAALHPDYAALEQRSFVQQDVNIEYCGQMQVIKRGSQKRYFSTPRLLATMALSTRGLVRFALRSKADIIHVGKPHPMNGLAGLAGRYLRNKTLLVDCDDYEAGSNRLLRQWQKNILARFERKIPRYGASVTTHTHFMKNKLLSWGIPEEKIYYLANGVDRERFSGLAVDTIALYRSELGLAGKKVIAYIGSLSLTSHPVDLLIDAFALVQAQNPETILLVVGGGEDFEALQGKVRTMALSDQVRFCGRVTPDRAPLYYRLADVSIDPVYNNDAARGRSPLKLFESWAAEVPFITADVGERSFLLGSPPAGLLAEPGNPASLAENILQVLTTPELSVQLKGLGRQRIQHYYWDVLAAQLEAHYEQFLERQA